MFDRYRTAASLNRFALLALVFALPLIVGAGCYVAKSNNESAESQVNRTLKMAHFDEGGWALTEFGLLSDADGEWTDVTPEQVRAGGELARSDGFFASATEAWVSTIMPAAGPAARNIRLAHTTDAGESWQTTNLELPPDQPISGSFDIFFLPDGQSGWVLVDIATSSAFSRGLLFGTSDGGQTWRSLSAPAFGDLAFSSTHNGSLAGGPTGSDLYATEDGGVTWEQREIPGTSSPERPSTSVASPRFFSAQEAIVPVQVSSETEGTSELTFYRTTDAGESWQTTGHPLVVQETDDLLTRDAPHLSIVDRDTWLLAADQLYATIDGGLTWSTLDFIRTIRSLRRISTTRDILTLGGISFVSKQLGWAYGENTRCAEKGDCTIEAFLISTVDGGRTWSDEPLPDLTTGHALSAGPQAVARPSPTETSFGAPTGGVLSFSEAWEQRSEIGHEEVTIDGRVVLSFECPDEPEPESCDATGYLVDENVGYIFPGEEPPRFVLVEGDEEVECVVRSLEPEECDGLEPQALYRVVGTVRRISLEGAYEIQVKSLERISP